MNKDAYVKTSMVYWSQEDESYICESPLFDRTLGVGDTREEAKQNFLDMLDEAIEFLKDGPIYERPGRPFKGNTNFHTKIKPIVKDSIKVLGEKLGGITAGEVLDYLVFYHDIVTNRFLVRDNKPVVEFKSASLQRSLTDQSGSSGLKRARNHFEVTEKVAL